MLQWHGDQPAIRILSNSIRVFDTKAPEKEKESSYHTFLVGLLTGNTDWVVRSNVEAGEGFADIIVEPEDEYYGSNVPLFRRNGYRQSGVMRSPE